MSIRAWLGCILGLFLFSASVHAQEATYRVKILLYDKVTPENQNEHPLPHLLQNSSNEPVYIMADYSIREGELIISDLGGWTKVVNFTKFLTSVEKENYKTSTNDLDEKKKKKFDKKAKKKKKKTSENPIKYFRLLTSQTQENDRNGQIYAKASISTGSIHHLSIMPIDRINEIIDRFELQATQHSGFDLEYHILENILNHFVDNPDLIQRDHHAMDK